MTDKEPDNTPFQGPVALLTRVGRKFNRMRPSQGNQSGPGQ